MSTVQYFLETTIRKRLGSGVDLAYASPALVAAYINASPGRKFEQSGVGGNRSLEPVPKYKQTISEKVMTNGRNAWVVLGVDRNASALGGHGGRGQTQCASIDLVAGRMGGYVRDRDDEGRVIEVNPDFKVDAARIYISQKADIDDYFECAEGACGNSIGQSAIGLKADDIRVIARKSIKLVTGTDNRDSQTDKVKELTGIELIANNDDSDMQPLVKGDNLVKALTGLWDQINDLNQIVTHFLKYQSAYNEKILSHRHLGNIQLPSGKRYTAVAFEMQPEGNKCIIQHCSNTESSLKNHQGNMSAWNKNYLSGLVDETYINSKNNKTN